MPSDLPVIVRSSPPVQRNLLDRLTLLALTFGGPVLLFPEILPVSVRAAIVVGAAVVTSLLATSLMVRSNRGAGCLMAILASTALVGWMRVPGSDAALSHFAGLCAGLLAMSGVVSWCRTGQRVGLAAGLFLLVGAVILAVGVVTIAIPRTKFISPSIVSWLPQMQLGLAGLERGNHVNTNALGGTALLIVFPAAAVSLLRAKNVPGISVLRTLGVIVALMSGLVLLVTQSRSAFVGGWLTLALLAMVLRVWWFWRALAVVTLLSLPLLVSEQFKSSSSSVLQDIERSARWSRDNRFVIWKEGVQQLKTSPWIGIGLNEFRYVYRPGGTDIAHVHNIFLQTALDVGLIGLATYVALLGWLLVLSRQAARGPDALAAGIAAGGGLCLVAVHMFGLGDAISLGAKVGIFQWIAAGLVVSAWQIQNERGTAGVPQQRGAAQGASG